MKKWVLFSCFIGLTFSKPLTAYIQSYETPIVHYLHPVEIDNHESNLQSVDCIFVINLNRRPDKWARVEKLFQEQKLYVNRFPAIDGWQQLTDEAVRSLVGNYQSSLNKGELGCLLSHVSILKEAYARGYSTIWIMEDDVEFVDDVQLIPKFLSALFSMDPDWDVFYTDTDGTYPSLSIAFRPDDLDHYPLEYYLKREVVGKGIMRTRQRFGAYSLLLSRKGIEKMLDYFTHVYLYEPIDIDMHYIPGIRQYSVIKDVVSTDNSMKPSNTKCE